jgi:uncharacterized protein
MGSALIALSGGVDSTFLAKVAWDTLGDRAMTVVAAGPIFSEQETKNAQNVAKEIGIPCKTILFDILTDPSFRTNPENRCYYCKKQMYTSFLAIASERGFAWVVDGTHAGDHINSRPGYQAIQTLGIATPLQAVHITKQEILAFSKALNLSTGGHFSGSCLATRIPYGSSIDNNRLDRVKRCETWMRERGFTQVRVRDYFPEARIELDPAEFNMVISSEIREDLVNVLISEGFEKIVLDLEGYKSKEK